jgi:hypothetical protein
MPPLVPYPGCLKVEILETVLADLDVSTRLHFLYTGTAPSNATCATIAADILALANTNILSLMSAANDLRGVTVQDLTSATAGAGESLATTTGTRGAGPYLAAETAALMNVVISRRYRGGKPRAYWPFGIAADLTTPQAWSTTALSDFNVGLDALVFGISALSVSGTNLGAFVSLSYYHGFTAVTNPITGRTRDVPTPRTVALAPDLVTGFSVNAKPGSQRRRQLHSA